MAAGRLTVRIRTAGLRVWLDGIVMLPVKKKSKSRSRSRRAHNALRPVTLSPCPKCGKPKLPHAACETCGYVSAKLVLPAGER